MQKTALFLVMLMLCAWISAATITLTHYERGWYDYSGVHNATNDNYIASTEHRDFFVFDLSSVTDYIVDATLKVYSASFSGVAATEIYRMFDVLTPVATLVAGGTGLTSIYNDLGAGTVYAERTVLSSEAGQTINITLNSNAIAAMNANHSLFAMAGILVNGAPGDPYRYIFGGSGGAVATQLVLNTSLTPPVVPEFNTLALFGLGLLALFVSKKH